MLGKLGKSLIRFYLVWALGMNISIISVHFLFTTPKLWDVDVRGAKEWSAALGLHGLSGENDIGWPRESCSLPVLFLCYDLI